MIPFVQDPDFTLYEGDALDVLGTLPDGSARACVTSPPYLDTRPEYPSPTLEEFGLIFRELRRVCTDAALFNVGRLWRAGVESLWWVDLIREAQGAGWALVDTAVWVKPNANPIHGNVFSNSHEYVLVFASAGDRLNEDGIRRPHAESTRARFGRGWTNHRGVKGFPDTKARKTTRGEPNPLGARPRSYIEIHVGKEKGNPHPAPMPLELAEWMVELASWPGDTIIDPFAGSGTTALAGRKHGRHVVAIEQDERYVRLAAERLGQQSLLADALVVEVVEQGTPQIEEPLGQIREPADVVAPLVEHVDQATLVIDVERDRTARPDGSERPDDAGAGLQVADPVEQSVAGVPGDDDLASAVSDGDAFVAALHDREPTSERAA